MNLVGYGNRHPQTGQPFQAAQCILQQQKIIGQTKELLGVMRP